MPIRHSRLPHLVNSQIEPILTSYGRHGRRSAGVTRSTMSSKCAKSYSDSASRALPYQQKEGSTRKLPGAVTPTPNFLSGYNGYALSSPFATIGPGGNSV